MTEKTKKGNFIELKFTGYQDGKPFDSNIPEDLKKINLNANTNEKTIVIIGQGMVIPGLDKALEDKEINKEYNVHVPYKEGFGQRKRELVKTIPLSVFREKNINPRPGMPLLMDNAIARVITISGARVLTDFNNPLSGKDLDYKFTITRVLINTDEKEKLESFFKYFFRTIPEFEIQEKKILVKGPEVLEQIITMSKEKFKEIFNKDIEFKKEDKKKEKTAR